MRESVYLQTLIDLRPESSVMVVELIPVDPIVYIERHWRLASIFCERIRLQS